MLCVVCVVCVDCCVLCWFVVGCLTSCVSRLAYVVSVCVCVVVVGCVLCLCVVFRVLFVMCWVLCV